MYHYTALVTCLAIAFYFFLSIQVSKARRQFGVKLPAISGNADFERVFRVHMNTLEWMPIFLPSLWLFAVYVSDPYAAAFRDQLERAASSIALTLAEGCARRTRRDRHHFFSIAQGSAMECAAAIDILRVTGCHGQADATRAKHKLTRIVQMLVGLRRC